MSSHKLVDFTTLRREFTSSTLLLPSDKGYDESLKRWSEAAEKRAAAVALVRSAEDISAAVKFAVRHSVALAVRGGGHATSGSSSSEEGMVIDLSRMRGVTVDPKSQTVLVQGGCIWEDVDLAAAEYDLACVGGTVNHTGVGGLTLGGGYGWLSARYGLAIDNLLYVTMVLADGSIVKASKEENPDLFWAVRGAGQSFGVVVEFCFQAYPQATPVTAGILAFPTDKVDLIVDIVNDFHENLLGQDCGMALAFSTPPGCELPVALAIIFYNGGKAGAEAKFAKLLALQPILNTVAEMPYSKVNSITNDGNEHGGRRCMNGSSVKMPLQTSAVRAVLDNYAEFTRSHENTNRSIVIFEIFSPDKVCEVPLADTATALRTRDVNVGISAQWLDKALDTKGRDWARGLGRLIRELGNPDGTFEVYANYSDVESRPRRLFGANYDRLVELKKKYDAGNVFHSWHDLSGTADEKEFV